MIMKLLMMNHKVKIEVFQKKMKVLFYFIDVKKMKKWMKSKKTFRNK
jgi:hypothetical protein